MVLWHTLSKALLKSSAMTATYGCVVRSRVTVCKIKISAAVVEPVDRKTY